MTRDVKYLVLALAMAATAGAVAPPSLRGVKDAYARAGNRADAIPGAVADAVADGHGRTFDDAPADVSLADGWTHGDARADSIRADAGADGVLLAEHVHGDQPDLVE